VLSFLLSLVLFGQPAPEHVVGVRIQGNTLTSDAAIEQMADVPPGTAVTPTLIADVEARLKARGRFERVEILKRYASISDLSQILLVIVVDEGRVAIAPMKNGQPARAVRRRGPPLMYLPILGSDEGYGFTYGALVSMPNVAGPRTRVSIPLTWGGERRVGAEVEKRLDTPRLTRLRTGGSLIRRENQALDAVDTRAQIWVRGEREIVRALRAGAWGGFDRVAFGPDTQVVRRAGVDVALDTRVDPMLSRNAVFVRGSLERLGLDDGRAPIRTILDANLYLPGFGASTIALRAYRDGVNEPVPGFLQVLRGRESTLRGFRAGEVAGDSTAAGSIELRVPVTNPLSLGKLGVRAFVDAAAVYDAGARFADQRFDRGVGGGVWFTATVLRLALDVAHGSNGSTRVQVSSGLLF